MEKQTTVMAETGQQDLLITRDFDLPVALLFKAFISPEIVAQWMGTQVLKLESIRHGSYIFETADPKGNKFRMSGVIHELIPNQKIVRTFEMENTPFEAQLEFLEFIKLTETTSKLNMHVIYKSNKNRDQVLQLPFAQGINMAHKRLQELLQKLI